ncbi:MAG: DUF1016 domain-containing protein [Nanoarchaeales archaeon]|nr:DUF1016 domain-containing protein [Nanoarchaeales archaeon]
MEKPQKTYVNLKENISNSIELAQSNVIKSINSELVLRNWNIGKHIVEFEQGGESRAVYGAETLKRLAVDLTVEYGKGFTLRNLEQFRKFHTLFEKTHALDAKLSWTNIKHLLSVKDENKRKFYTIECRSNNWSSRELERQINSQLYDRLLMSKDKDKVLEMSKLGQVIEKPSDLIRDPIILDFLNLKEEPSYSEKEVESKIIDRLQDFLLELGKGFTFVSRQYRITLDNVNYYADLVFFNRFLKCFVVIELKIGKVKPEHLGQLQFYVNYFNKYEKTDFENKTIGILVCEEKNSAVVKLSLPENNEHIFAVEYKKYLPSEKELQKIINE